MIEWVAATANLALPRRAQEITKAKRRTLSFLMWIERIYWMMRI